MLDKTIQYTFIDGNISGIKFLEFTKGELIGFSIPKKMFNKDIFKINYLTDFINNSGIYFLIGDEIYIGQAIDLFKRLELHVRGGVKEFNNIILFTTTNNSFDEGDINFLEKNIIKVTRNVGVNNLTNITNGNKTNIKEFRKSDILGYIDEIKFLLKVLGYDFMEEKVKKEELSKNDNLYYLNIGEVKASMIYNENGYIVLKGSIGKNKENNSVVKGYIRLKNELIEKGNIIVNGDKIEFLKNIEFTSSTGPAQILLGYSVSGPEKWKNDKGKTLRENEIKIK